MANAKTKRATGHGAQKKKVTGRGPMKLAKKTHRGRGRPPTAQMREQAERLLGASMGNEDIAAVMDLSLEEFERRFAPEVKVGRAKARARIIEALYEHGCKGNVSAAKVYLQMGEAGSAEDEFMRKADAAAEAADRPEPKKAVSKKEAAQQAAMTAGQDTEWGDDLSGPSSVN